MDRLSQWVCAPPKSFFCPIVCWRSGVMAAQSAKPLGLPVHSSRGRRRLARQDPVRHRAYLHKYGYWGQVLAQRLADAYQPSEQTREAVKEETPWVAYPLGRPSFEYCRQAHRASTQQRFFKDVQLQICVFQDRWELGSSDGNSEAKQEPDMHNLKEEMVRC